MEKKKRGRPRKPRYKVVLTLSGSPKEYKGEGFSLAEALENMERPTKLMAKGFIEATDGEKYTKLWMMPTALKRFMRPAFLYLQATRLERIMR